MNIKNVFNKHNLIIPDYDNPNFVDLMIALYTRFGTNIKKSKNSDSLSKQIPNNKHTLFILLDGAGSNLIDSLEDNSVLKENKQCNLLTVSPSTTGCVLTSLATAKYPSEHGIIGWFSYNREFDRDYYPLLYADRKSGKSLIEFGIKPEDIYKEKSLLNHLKIDTKVFFPNYINESVYSKFVINDINRISYQSISDAFEKINARINEIDKSYTYLYIPDIDSLSHECGVYSPLIKEKIKEIEYGIKLLFKNKNLTIVATADHGQIDVINDVVMDFYKYDKFFYALPGIDFGTATYYIKKDKEKEFVLEFNKDFKDRMFLFKTKEFLKHDIFGKPVSQYLKDNLGEYISVCKKGYYLINDYKSEDYFGKIKGSHAGFSSEELIIPLIIINSNEQNN